MPEIPAGINNGTYAPHESFFENNPSAFAVARTYIKLPQIITKEAIMALTGGDIIFAREIFEPASC